MSHRTPSLMLLLSIPLLLLLMGCAPTAPTSTIQPTSVAPATTEAGASVIAEPTTIPDATAEVAATVAPTDTTATDAPADSPAGEPVALTAAPEEIPPEHQDSDDEAVYLDDRSNGETVVRSLFNAINSRQYLRAYSYWDADAEGLPSFEAFEQSFAETYYVDLFNVGEVMTEAGAGQQYSAVPYIISVTNTDGSVEAFAGCYLMHLANPAIQATPPFEPLAIQAAAIRQMGEGDDSYTISEQLCQELMGS